MGGCCSSSGANADTSKSTVSPKAPAKCSGAAEPHIGSRAAAAATAAVASAEDLKARARRRALQALVESLQHGESVIPSPQWRRQYLKTNAIGPAVIFTIVNYIQSKSGAAATGVATTSSSSSAAAAPTSRPRRGKHDIHTLDLRALRTGDDGFVEMMNTLLDDTLVENVIFAGNEITDEGVHRLMKQIDLRKGATAAAAARAELPCQLKFIGLTDNFITSSGIADLASIAPLFCSLEQLEVGRGQSGGGEDVDDVRDTLSLKDVKAISTYIQRTPSLSTFLYKGTGNYYARSGFSPDGFAMFADIVVGHSALRELYLQDCFSTRPALIGPVTVQAPRGKANVAASPPAPNEPDESWSPEHLLQSFQSLPDALCVPATQLSTLVLRFPLSDDAVQVLTKGLGGAPHLSNLSLRCCDMSGKALAYIGDALASNRALRMLDVSYQSNTIAHPAYLAEMRNSSKRHFSYTSSASTAHSAADMARLEMSSGSSEMPSREERQHPLLPIIRSLHQNRSLVQLVMLGVNITTDDVEELCACIERSRNKTLSEVWYTTAGNDALKMKLEDFLAANRDFGGVGNGVGPSAVSSVRSSAIRVSGSSANFFPDSTSLSDRSESFSRTPTERVSTTRNTNGNILFSPSSPPPPIPHHPPRPNGTHGTANAAENTNAERPPAMSLGNTALNLKAGTAKTAVDGESRSVLSTASPSQVAVSVEGAVGKSTVSQRSKTLRFTNSESLPEISTAERTDDTPTLPYSSQMPSARKARPN
ncbi:hypothetical protein ABB37_03319 [Leptomonas pyrrhocoris]|uniref:Uncharacterized protein n=1 Tax=Leptomonas pyrrhocoris TaxID=157538 RepID=A0A0M9G4Q1_LEPPY|nr:hypothetical protein ABB37_03319 [Leptomonas pyrrhocoris]KPA82197.1 hypothetical protein ABB37_03319 [Leptomonas pyrrhocoris]|eukprot:XP_015660636.1 hypothetical protein ABB37_03319 [Leptomonas pyrrhocoris]